MADFYRGVKYLALRRLRYAESLRMEGRFCERDHLLRTMKMKIGLHAADSFGARLPLCYCDVPDVAELIFHASLAITRDVVVHRVGRCCACLQSPLVGGVGIVDIQMDRDRAGRILLARVSQLNHR